MRQANMGSRRGSPVLAAAAASLMAAALAGCAVRAEPYPSGPVYYEPGYPQGVHVPPGHLPPPGMCRIWYPDRPPGHQPPPDHCGKLQYRVPPGAVLVRG